MKIKQTARKSTSISCLNDQIRRLGLKSRPRYGSPATATSEPALDSSGQPADGSASEYKPHFKKIDLEKLLEAERPKPAGQRNRSSARAVAMARQTLENIIESKRRSLGPKPASK